MTVRRGRRRRRVIRIGQSRRRCRFARIAVAASATMGERRTRRRRWQVFVLRTVDDRHPVRARHDGARQPRTRPKARVGGIVRVHDGRRADRAHPGIGQTRVPRAGAPSSRSPERNRRRARTGNGDPDRFRERLLLRGRGRVEQDGARTVVVVVVLGAAPGTVHDMFGFTLQGPAEGSGRAFFGWVVVGFGIVDDRDAVRQFPPRATDSA